MPSRTLQKDELLPQSYALKSMNQLRDWTPSKDSFNIPSIALQPRKTYALKPRLILCHDMAGGYKEDKYIQGNDYATIYNCQYLHFVDMFIYFSHERVSIPPVNWTNACHRNGVKCLGTFLTEGDQMHEMEALLQGPPLAAHDSDNPMRLWSPFYADKLVAIAKHYGFDGWLINIECEFFPFPTNSRFKARELAKFIDYLTKKMHAEIPGSQIIWYDSMTIAGEIKWQNQLTHLNEIFFEKTDGIFLNYWWKREYPEMTRRLAERHGKSGLEVYFGTDVWGRHTYGGGGFKSYKGVKAASSAQTSSALFGMAWTYENFETSEFEKMDRLFWYGGAYSEYPPPKDPKEITIESDDSEDELMYGHRKGIADIAPTNAAPGGNWLVTTFDRGFGSRFYYRGKKLLDQPWSHLSHQAILPNLNYRNVTNHQNDTNVDISCSLQSNYGAFLSGTSLVFQGQRLTHRESRDLEAEISVPLYHLSIDASRGCSLRYIYRTLLGEDVKLVMSCHFSLKTSNKTSTEDDLWTFRQKTNSVDKEDVFRATIHSDESSRCLSLSATQEITGENDWITKTIEIPACKQGDTLHINRIEMNVIVNTSSLVGIKPHVIACLGYLSVIPFSSCSMIDEQKLTGLSWKDTFIEKVSPLSNEQEEAFRLFGTLSWKDTNYTDKPWKETDYYMISYEIDSNVDTRLFLGTSFCSQYRVSGLDCINRLLNHRIIVQAVNREGYISSIASLEIIIP